MKTFDAWVADNREALISGMLTATELDLDLDAALDSVVDAWKADRDDEDSAPVRDEFVVGSWPDVVEAVGQFIEAEGMVPESWMLVVEEGTSSEMRVFSGDTNITVAHFAGVMHYAIRRVEEVGGVEG